MSRMHAGEPSPFIFGILANSTPSHIGNAVILCYEIQEILKMPRGCQLLTVLPGLPEDPKHNILRIAVIPQDLRRIVAHGAVIPVECRPHSCLFTLLEKVEPIFAFTHCFHTRVCRLLYDRPLLVVSVKNSHD